MPPRSAAQARAATTGSCSRSSGREQYCPNAILILNDYNTIEYGNDNNHFIDIVNRIQAAGAPIDAIGAQAHAAYNMPTNTVKMYLDKHRVRDGPARLHQRVRHQPRDDNAQQRQVMESQFTMFWNNENVAGITLWGYIQGQTWLANTGLMSSGGQQRPAMTWLMDFLARALRASDPPRARLAPSGTWLSSKRGPTLPSSTGAAFDATSDTIWNHNHPVRALAVSECFTRSWRQDPGSTASPVRSRSANRRSTRGRACPRELRFRSAPR